LYANYVISPKSIQGLSEANFEENKNILLQYIDDQVPTVTQLIEKLISDNEKLVPRN
jgi:hypothetical protein